MQRWNAFAAILAAVILCSCSTMQIPELSAPLAGTEKGLTPSEFREHVLMFNFRGKLLDPLSSSGPVAEVGITGYREIEQQAAPRGEASPSSARTDEEYLQRVIDGIVRRKQASGRVEVLLFFHGGLNTRAKALKRAARQIVAMRADRPELYPVFVNWETSLPASYKDHLLWIRNGQDTYTAGTILTPFVFLSDVGRSALDIPVANFMQFKEQRRHWQEDPYRDFVRVGTDCKEDEKLDFRAGPPHDPTTMQKFRSNAVSTVMTILTKWWVAGVLSATGSKAWASMLYTSDRLFYSDHELHQPYNYVGKVTGSGGLSEFLRALDAVLAEKDDVILVAHSAGAVVAGKIVALFGEELPIKTLVYMAPAATIDDLKDGGRVAEFLGRDETRKLYILTLHERAEVSKRFFLDLTPRGTLLAWLDEFIQPKHSEFPGMMMGRARNLRLHAHNIPCRIRPQISITAFAEQLSGTPTQPQTHSSFGVLQREHVEAAARRHRGQETKKGMSGATRVALTTARSRSGPRFPSSPACRRRSGGSTAPGLPTGNRAC